MYINIAKAKDELLKQNLPPETINQILNFLNSQTRINLNALQDGMENIATDKALAEIEKILNQRIDSNSANLSGEHLPVWEGIYRGRESAYNDILSVVKLMRKENTNIKFER